MRRGRWGTSKGRKKETDTKSQKEKDSNKTNKRNSKKMQTREWDSQKRCFLKSQKATAETFEATDFVACFSVGGPHNIVDTGCIAVVVALHQQSELKVRDVLLEF